MNDETYEARGRHLLLTLFGCSGQNLNDEAFLRELTMRAATASGATVLQLASHKFQPQGITAVAVLAESHASLHTYPESSVVFWDCFTCGDSCDPMQTVQVLVDALEPSKTDAQIVERGLKLESTGLKSLDPKSVDPKSVDPKSVEGDAMRRR
jgi:S-adenosylmethionine decarboxylase